MVYMTQRPVASPPLHVIKEVEPEKEPKKKKKPKKPVPKTISPPIEMSNPKKEFFKELALLGISLAATGLLMGFLMRSMDPKAAAKKRAADEKRKLWAKFGLAGKFPVTTLYEDILISEGVVMAGDEIDTKITDIGGLEEIIKDLKRKVLQPFENPDLFNSSLLVGSKGVLLYGPPGTGKTMIAKALAKAANARFMIIRASTMQSKWLGDTQKQTSAIFTLAQKISPCIIFIDEVDAVLGKRRIHEHEAITSMKTEFMQLWDGFLTQTQHKICVLAATNRREELDEAVLRRFSSQYHVPLPDAKGRESILSLILRRYADDYPGHRVLDNALLENVARGSRGKRPLQELAEVTNNCSGSALKQICSDAAMSCCAMETQGHELALKLLTLEDLKESAKSFTAASLPKPAGQEGDGSLSVGALGEAIGQGFGQFMRDQGQGIPAAWGPSALRGAPPTRGGPNPEIEGLKVHLQAHDHELEGCKAELDTVKKVMGALQPRLDEAERRVTGMGATVAALQRASRSVAAGLANGGRAVPEKLEAAEAEGGDAGSVTEGSSFVQLLAA